MRTTPLAAALKRLRAYAAWDGDSPSPYADSGHSHLTDLKLTLRAIDLLVEASHVDDRDMLPVFEVMPDCLWTNATRGGLIQCLGVALVNEDAPEGGTFK